MAKKLTPAMVPFAVLTKPDFPSLDQVLDNFASNNGLPKPRTVTYTESRGLLAYFDNGDHFNLYSSEDSTSAYDVQYYGLEGRIDGTLVSLGGSINLPRSPERNGKKLKKHTLRYDQNTSYIFLGKEASAQKPIAILRG